jgi:anti-anti-sigma factor
MDPAQTQFEWRSAAGDERYILGVKGIITRQSVSSFNDAVRAATHRFLILDLTEMPRIDSLAIGALVQAYVSCQKANRKLALVGATNHVRNVLRITGVESLFAMYEKTADAEAALR